MKLIVAGLLIILAACALDVNGTRSTGGADAARCVQVSPDLIRCSSR
jgi:hypothetical protein